MQDAHRPPYEAYAAIAGVFFGGLVAASGAARAAGRDCRELGPIDLVTLGGATFKLARTISREPVGSWLREPFVEEEAYRGREHPAGEGARRAIGELVTCTRCLGTWCAAGLGTAQVLTPRFGRLLTWTLTAAAASDFLQAGFAGLTRRVNALEREPA